MKNRRYMPCTRPLGAACLGLAVGLLLSACGASQVSSSTTTKPSSVSSAEAKIRALLPASYKPGRVIAVATDASYPPYEFYGSNNKTIIGVDPDLGHAIGKILGLNFEFSQVTFDEIPTEIAAHRYDLSMSGMGDFKYREKVVNFIDYALFGEGLLVTSDSSFKATSLSEVCGDTISVESGTSEEIQLSQQSKNCTSSGRKAITSLVFPSETTAVLALRSHRAQALFQDLATVAWVAKESPGQFKVLVLVDKQIAGLTGPYGIALPKNSPLLRPVEAALKLLMKNGAYQAILAKWGVQVDAIRTVTVNGATS